MATGHLTSTSNNSQSQLTASELERLQVLEMAISEDMAGFVRVGTALQEINEKRLYRATHATFAEYLSDRWGIGRGRAYQLIESAKVMNTLEADLSTPVDKTTLPDAERQTRELAKVAPEKQAAAWTKSQQRTNKPQPTAAQIRQTIQLDPDLQPRPAKSVSANKPRPAVVKSAVRHSPTFPTGLSAFARNRLIELTEDLALTPLKADQQEILKSIYAILTATASES